MFLWSRDGAAETYEFAEANLILAPAEVAINFHVNRQIPPNIISHPLVAINEKACGYWHFELLRLGSCLSSNFFGQLSAEPVELGVSKV